MDPFYNTTRETVVAQWTPPTSPKHTALAAPATPELPLEFFSLLDPRMPTVNQNEETLLFDCRKWGTPLCDGYVVLQKTTTSLALAALLVFTSTSSC